MERSTFKEAQKMDEQIKSLEQNIHVLNELLEEEMPFQIEFNFKDVRGIDCYKKISGIHNNREIGAIPVGEMHLKTFLETLLKEYQNRLKIAELEFKAL